VDPLDGLWKTELQLLLERDPQLEPTTVFEALQEAYPGAYGTNLD